MIRVTLDNIIEFFSGNMPLDDDLTILFFDSWHDFHSIDTNHIRKCLPHYGEVRGTLQKAYGRPPEPKELIFSIAYVFLARNCPALTDYK